MGGLVSKVPLGLQDKPGSKGPQASKETLVLVVLPVLMARPESREILAFREVPEFKELPGFKELPEFRALLALTDRLGSMGLLAFGATLD
jgi:hypothetical protein